MQWPHAAPICPYVIAGNCIERCRLAVADNVTQLTPCGSFAIDDIDSSNYLVAMLRYIEIELPLEMSLCNGVSATNSSSSFFMVQL